ncbi:MAG: hypothetical protein HGA78_03435 [Nitrospirales bacterium]|nr:hypothetical protein [Nitrospirales bacterium]
MSSSVCNKQGITLIEVLIAVLLVMVAVMALLSLQPQGWRQASRADFIGRAAEILHKELETNEGFIMNPCNANSLWGVALPTTLNGTISNTATVFAGGMSTAQPGDVTLTVVRTITMISAFPPVWRITVRVTWPSNATGIQESTWATRQDGFRQGC